MNLRFDFAGHRIGVDIFSRRIRKETVVGYTNRTVDANYIITLDYDNLDVEMVKQELVRLQNDYGLSDFYIFLSSTSGVHAVCFDKVSFHELLDIMRQTSVDPNYLRVPIMTGSRVWVLRVTDKNNKEVEFFETVKSPNLKHDLVYEKSNAHRIFINKIFNLEIKKDSTFDDHNELKLARYPLS